MNSQKYSICGLEIAVSKTKTILLFDTIIKETVSPIYAVMADLRKEFEDKNPAIFTTYLNRNMAVRQLITEEKVLSNNYLDYSEKLRKIVNKL